MPATVTNGYAALLAGGTVPLAVCVQVIRGDGAVFGWTNQQSAVVLPAYTPDYSGALTVPGATYLPSCAVSDLAMKRSLSPDNFTMKTQLSDTLLEADIEGELFDGAEWWLLLPIVAEPWSATDATGGNGYMIGGHGFDANITIDGQEVTFEFFSLTNALTEEILDKTSGACRYELGDSNCQVNMTGNMVDSTPIRVGAAITAVTNRSQFTIATTIGLPSNKFTNGLCQFLTGNNASIPREIMSFDETTGIFQLRFAAPFDIEVGDTVTLSAGCLKALIADCVQRFGNGVRFGGEGGGLPTVETINETTN